MNEQNIVFKTSLRGYKKNDVNEYIASENKRFANVERSFLATIENLRGDLKNAEDEIARLAAIAENLEAKLSIAETENNSLISKLNETEIAYTTEIAELKNSVEQSKGMFNTLREDYDKLSTELEAKNEELGTCTARMSEATERIADAKNETFLISEKYNNCCEELADVKKQLSDALNEANNTKETKPTVSIEQTEVIANDLLSRAKDASEEMLRRAENSTALIMSKAKEEALSCRSDMLNVAHDMLTSVSEELHRSVDICMNDFVRGIKSARNDSDLIAGELKRCGDELGRRIERLQMELDRSISDKLSEFDRKHGLLR